LERSPAPSFLLAGLGTVDRVRHPAGEHGVQDLVSGRAVLDGEQIAGVEDFALTTGEMYTVTRVGDFAGYWLLHQQNS
jgi:hypothetical protein